MGKFFNWASFGGLGTGVAFGMARDAAKGGVPDQMPFNLTAKYAIRQAMQNSLALANRINDRVGVQDISGATESQSIFTPADIAKRVQKQKIQMGMGNPGVGVNGQ